MKHASDLLNRFLHYVSFETTSSETSGTHPSSPGQRVFAAELAAELDKIGMQNISLSEHAYVTAHLPASAGLEKLPGLGFIAHLDTSPDAPGKHVRPRVIPVPDVPLELGHGVVLDPAKYPELKALAGGEIVVTDGSTLLGADDKAGIAEIMTAMEQVIREEIPHPSLHVCFTPDEEIGEGTMFFDVPSFGAAFAFTMDGGKAGTFSLCNFNAVSGLVRITGVSAHPGSARGIMVNAQRVAMEFASLLPAEETPENTSGREGFFHLTGMSGCVEHAEMHWILRDHDRKKLEQKKRSFRRAARILNEKYAYPCVKIRIREQYRNMEEIIRKHPFLIRLAEESIRKAGLVPSERVIRGGTDGAMLSFCGLPCPNLGTGGYGAHGRSEFASVAGMEASVRVILGIIQDFSHFF